MRRWVGFMLSALLLIFTASTANADRYNDTMARFKNAGASAAFFGNSYGYAVFPTIRQGGLVIGGARGSGRVFRQGRHVGDTTMTQVSVGAQIGGRAYSMMIFFEDERAFREFTNGNFEFGADAQAVAITAAASSQVGTTGGASAGASAGRNDATTAGGFRRGVAVFTIVSGGAMVQAAIAGQKFSYTPRSSS
jgi:lipid-binding SYLF domain-containing protein